MDYPLIFIIILFIIEIICIILYLHYYSEIYDRKYNNLMFCIFILWKYLSERLTDDIYEAEDKSETKIVEEFENIFGKKCRGLSCLRFDFSVIIPYIICIIIGLFSAIGSFAYCCAKNNLIAAIVIFIICALLNIYNICGAFEKEEINVEGNIYKYDNELNSRIKDAVDMVHTRSIFLKTTSFLILIIIIVIILNLFLLKKKTDKTKNLNSQADNNKQNDLNNNDGLNTLLNN